MLEQSTWSLAFIPEEVYLLTHLLGVDDLPHWQEAIGDAALENLQRRLDTARRSLVARGFIEVKSGGEVEIDAAVVALVTSAAMPRQTLVASRRGPDRAARCRLIHLGQDLIVEQEAPANDQIALTAVQDRRVLAQRLRAFINLPKSPAAPGGALQFGMVDVMEARRLADVGALDECFDVLERAGATPALATALAQTLAEGISGSIARWDGRTIEAPLSGGLAWLVGQAGSWRIRPLLADAGSKGVSLIPCAIAGDEPALDAIEALLAECGTAEVQQRVGRVGEEGAMNPSERL